ncbi:hypothetical protein [Paraburkholderia bannensis]|uniref:hypothetical protein n=1 Tax=Paraburkholderia bannensis TaxID=765414 RepID=UPI002AB2F237|nr:hypothetical protein [Paraburkholderia bannensis]
MTSFVDLQQAFSRAEFTSIGIDSARGQVLQPAAVLSDEDSDLWSYLDVLPARSPVFAPTGRETFFDAYSALINSLIAGTNPLDPIKSAKQRLSAWGTKPAAWSAGTAALGKQLQAAPSVSFDFSNDDVPDPPFWGLWTDSLPASSPSDLFASGDVSGQFKLAHSVFFAPTPSSDWYVSSALSLAYARKSGLPWNPDSPITWETTFGANGNMQRLVGGLCIASGVNLQYSSTAIFSKADQIRIIEAGAQGIWPYYFCHDDAVTKLRFDHDGKMNVSVACSASKAVVFAASVLTASEYLGG